MPRTEPRDLGEVIDALLEVIPPGEVELRAELAKQRCDTRYRAPELAAEGWNRVSHILMDLVGDPAGCEWKQQVGLIFAGEAPDA